MSDPKRWGKAHRKASSKSSLASNLSGGSLDDRFVYGPPTSPRPPPSPPIHLPKEDTTAATAIVDFGGSGSTLMSQRSDVATLSGGPLTLCSNSSMDSISTGFTQSPSTTPPKKTWEKNYRSFLKMTGKQSKHQAPATSYIAPRPTHVVPIKPLPRAHLTHSMNTSKSSKSFSDNASGFLSKAHDHQHRPVSSAQNANGESGPSLADGFEDHSLKSVGSQLTTNHDNRLMAPPSPSKHKESGGARGIFKRLRSKTKSVDNLDASMRRGHDRKSPTNTPPGSVSSTPTPKSSPLISPGVTALQEGMEKAAMLSDSLKPPTLTSSSSLGMSLIKKQQLGSNNVLRSTSSQVGLHSNDDNNLDSPRHRGHSVTMAPSTVISSQQTQTNNTSTKLPTLPIPGSMFSRVQSMGSNLIIPEGEPAIINNKDDQLLREKRKAFTDFHNMGIDSSSAYLGDESSLHRHSVFLSSMAYPAGSAGGKVHSQRHSFSQNGAHSLDQKRDNISSSISTNSISGKSVRTPQHGEESDTTISPERALRSLKGPEHWTKGERHAIVPGILSMCPIQVLNNIMSKEEEEGVSSGTSRASLTSRGSQRGFGIGSIISQDEGLESNGWFFADHHNHQPTSSAGGTLPLPRHGGGVSSNNALPSAVFGKILLGKATVAPVGMRSFLNEVYGWTTGVFVLRQNYLFEYREGDSLNGLPWGYAHLPLGEAYPHKHFTNALHLDFFEKPCSKSGKRSLLLRVESKSERDRWVSMLQSASRMTINDLYDVDESDGSPEFGRGRFAVVRPAHRRGRRRAMSFSESRYPHTTSNSQDSFRNISSYDSLGGCNNMSSNTDLEGTSALGEYNCALKIIDKREFWSRVKKGRERADTLVREAAVQMTLAVQGGSTPGFLRLRNIFETSDTLVLELEILKGTDLFQHVSSRGGLGEVEAAHIMRDLLNCLNVLDQVGICHRDIKPANLLMCHNENNDGTKIKLADYGMASFVGVDNLVRGRCGTPGFVAPEILLTGINGGYGNKVDMFSAGVTLYVMLAGYEPFYGESDAELIDANREAKVDFPHADWHTVSVEGRDLIERMLVIDPSKRIGPSEALSHPWITRRL